MQNTKLTIINNLLSWISLGLLLISLFFENKQQIIIVISALILMIIQKIVEIFIIKKIKKISFPILIFLILVLVYLIITKF